MMQIFVRKLNGNNTTLNVDRCERVCNIKRKLKEKEGIRSDLHLGLIYKGNLLGDEHTLAHYNILHKSTLQLFLSQHTFVKTWDMYVETWSMKMFSIKVMSVDTIDDVKAKIQEKEGIPPHNQLLFLRDEWLEDGSRTLADYGISNHDTLQLAIQFQQGPQSAPTQPQVAPPQSKRARPATRGDGEVTGALSDLIPEIRSDPPPSVQTELEDLKREMSTARSKEKELEATISGLTQKNHVFSAQCASYESQIVGLKAENKKTEEELTVARNKQKELEATISGLTHKNKVFSAQCASYESEAVALEVENKKTKEELMHADKKYYAGARAAGYAEGLKEGKSKWLKSVEFLHHLTDASMRYFNHGFDSCQKQAEQQGFLGQLNKDSALEEAPELKGWESGDQPQ